MKRDYVPLAVVARWDGFHEHADPEVCLSLKEAFDTQEEAEAEVARLNDLRRGPEDPVRYFLVWVRYYPDGRNVVVDY